jgi:hypothetical protein
MASLCRAGRAEALLDLVEQAPKGGAATPVWDFLIEEGVFESLFKRPRIDMPLVTRFVRRLGATATPTLLSAAVVFDDAKMRLQFYELLQPFGDEVAPAVAERIPDAPPTVQRELLALLGRLNTLPPGFSAENYLGHSEPLVRREAVRLLLREESAREKAIMSALADADDRVVFAGLTAAQEKCPRAAIELIKERVDRGELDSQLRTMGIRIVAHQRTSDALEWLLGFVVTEAHWPRRLKLRQPTPEMLAALGVVVSGWRNHPGAATVLRLAEQSKVAEVRAKLAHGHAATSERTPSNNE